MCNVIHCECKVLGKKCSTEVCDYAKECLSCLPCCNCSDEDGCWNPCTNTRRA